MRHLLPCLPRMVLAAITLLVLSGCRDTFVPPPEDGEEASLFPHVVTCRADVLAGSVSCGGLTGAPAPGLSLAAIVGGQGTYVLLVSDNVSYASGVFQADVTVTNLIANPMGTPDGTTVTGIRVFFHTGPTVTSGTGSVTVAGADGTGTFTASEPQPYYLYNEILQRDETSAAKTWRWTITGDVQAFEFSVYVHADIPVASGDWTATPTPAFGTVEFTVNPEGNAITFVWVRFDNFTCGSAFRDGSIGFGGSWAITDRQFSIDRTDAGGDRFVVEGTFTTLGDAASGTWEFTLSGTTCSGTWQAEAEMPSLLEGMFQTATDFGGIEFYVDTTGDDHISRMTFGIEDWTCGSETWDTTFGSYGWIADIDEEPGTYGVFSETRYSPFHIVINGTFESPDRVVGDWTAGTCGGVWEGGYGTRLFLRYDSGTETLYLSDEGPGTSTWVTTLPPGNSAEFPVVLGTATAGDVYTFTFWLASGMTAEAPDGYFDVSLVEIDDGLETELAGGSLRVPYRDVYKLFSRVWEGQAAGGAGSELILRVTFVGPPESEIGELAFGKWPTPFESHVTMPGVTTVATAQALAAATTSGPVASPGVIVRRYEGAASGTHEIRRIGHR